MRIAGNRRNGALVRCCARFVRFPAMFRASPLRLFLRRGCAALCAVLDRAGDGLGEVFGGRLVVVLLGNVLAVAQPLADDV